MKSEAGKLSRRRFLTLAAGSAAAVGGSAVLGEAVAQAAKVAATRANKAAVPAKTSRSTSERPGRRVASPKVIAEYREQLAGMLAAIRKHELPPGSEQGFAFRPLERGKSK